METKFQTSFIPKKPTGSPIGSISTAPSRKHTSSIFMMIATFLFILSIVSAGGAYAWKQYLIANQATLKNELATREQQFNFDLIQQLKTESSQIDLARQVINSHIALSGIFDIIGRMTIESVRFLSLDVTVPPTVGGMGGAGGGMQAGGGNGIKVALRGYGTSFSAVAFQSDVLGQLDQYGLRNIVKNPILANPSLAGNNTVAFDFSATIDPSTLSYERSVAPASASSSAPVGGQSSNMTQ